MHTNRIFEHRLDSKSLFLFNFGNVKPIKFSLKSFWQNLKIYLLYSVVLRAFKFKVFLHGFFPVKLSKQLKINLLFHEYLRGISILKIKQNNIYNYLNLNKYSIFPLDSIFYL